MKTTEYADALIADVAAGHWTPSNPFRRDGERLWGKYDAVRLEPAGEASRWVLLYKGRVLATEDTPGRAMYGDEFTLSALRGEAEVFRGDGRPWFASCPTCARPW